jgi:hypothetical protein
MDSQALQGCDKLHYLVGDSASDAPTKGFEGFTLILRNLHWSHARLAILVTLRDRIALGTVPSEHVLELESMPG